MKRPRSHWRETEWLIELIQAATWPPLRIADCLSSWNQIAQDSPNESEKECRVFKAS